MPIFVFRKTYKNLEKQYLAELAHSCKVKQQLLQLAKDYNQLYENTEHIIEAFVPETLRSEAQIYLSNLPETNKHKSDIYAETHFVYLYANKRENAEIEMKNKSAAICATFDLKHQTSYLDVWTSQKVYPNGDKASRFRFAITIKGLQWQVKQTFAQLKTIVDFYEE